MSSVEKLIFKQRLLRMYGIQYSSLVDKILREAAYEEEMESGQKFQVVLSLVKQSLHKIGKPKTPVLMKNVKKLNQIKELVNSEGIVLSSQIKTGTEKKTKK